MNFKALMKKISIGHTAVSVVTAAAVLVGTPAIAADLYTTAAPAYSVDYTSTMRVEEVIPHKTVKVQNNGLAAGTTRVVQTGKDGLQVSEYQISYSGGVEVSRSRISSSVVSAAVDEIIQYGPGTSTVSSAAASTSTAAASSSAAVSSSSGAPKTYKYVLECTATAYDPSPEENGGYGGMSATGVPLKKGVIAVDPKVIPLGSQVYIEALDGSWSYGYAVAADTGGAIKGNKVDLCFMTKSECYQFGRRQCRVYVL